MSSGRLLRGIQNAGFQEPPFQGGSCPRQPEDRGQDQWRDFGIWVRRRSRGGSTVRPATSHAPAGAGLSVQGLADAADLSVGMVSRIERGLSTPSLRSLRLLGIALGVPISWFFTAPDQSTPSGSPYLVRRGDRRLLRLTQSSVMKELLSPDTDGRLMEMYELTIEPGGSSGVDFYNLKSDEFGPGRRRWPIAR